MASITKDEPVLVGSASAALVGAVLTALVTHGVITDTQASGLTQTVVPLVTAGLIAGLGVLLRRFVSPASKVKAIVEQGLHIGDADFGRLDALLEQYGMQLAERALPAEAHAEGTFVNGKPWTPESATTPAEPVTTAPTTAPDGMSAGTTTPAQ
jgi:hypothetical protein